MYQINYRSFSFGSSVKLSTHTLDILISIFRSEPSGAYDTKSILNGRGSIKSIHIPETGDVVIKEYQRGGLVHYFNKNIYIKLCREVRSRTEFKMLVTAEKAGINVPSPMVYASRGGLFYKTWLITKKINKCRNFADLSVNNEKRAFKIFPEISGSIKKLIKNNIYHVDLHPGNVLVDENDKNYIIDFDKASKFRGETNQLQNLYKKRWTRAVLKYDLPDFLLLLDLK